MLPHASLRKALLLAGLLAVSTVGAAAAQTAVIDQMVNTQRDAAGLPVIAPNPQLSAAAQAHADDMARRGYFSHRAPEGTNMVRRVQAQGYCHRLLAENIAWGYNDASQVMRGWMNSPGHRANILRHGVAEYGIGKRGDYWVMVLGQSC